MVGFHKVFLLCVLKMDLLFKIYIFNGPARNTSLKTNFDEHAGAWMQNKPLR